VRFRCAAFGCALAFAAGRTLRLAGSVAVFVIGVEPGLAAFTGRFFLDLREAAGIVIGVTGLFGEGACLLECFAVDRWDDRVLVPDTFFFFFRAVRELFVFDLRLGTG
jgi:hypothetical protein